jgi:hypothetical protein
MGSTLLGLGMLLEKVKERGNIPLQLVLHTPSGCLIDKHRFCRILTFTTLPRAFALPSLLLHLSVGSDEPECRVVAQNARFRLR